jgi:D-alanine--poly(phosphoribitol) ligase subunit 1
LTRIVQPLTNNNPSIPIATGFLRNVILHPNRKALFVDERYYTYLELWQIVDAIYTNIPSDTTVDNIGIYCTNDVFTYASILAVNLYGAAYVPLNEKFPPARNINYVKQCAIKLVLASAKNETTRALDKDIRVVFTKTVIENNTATETFASKEYKRVEQPIAYILFTSGTTGDPKGVPVPHSNVNHFFDYFLTHFDFNETDKFLQVFELTFDVSVFSFFMPLLVGGCCYIVPNEGIKYLKIMDYLQRYEITAVSMVPTILRYVQPYLSQIHLPHMRFSMFVGDSLFYDLASQWKKSIPNAKLYNMYGPTEATIVCTSFNFNGLLADDEQINGIMNIGKAFDGLSIHIINEDNSPAEKGELCVAGAQVISHYLNNEQKDKFFEYKGERYYKTGDIVSKNKTGNLLFHGRKDTQVKINGYRVELSEIENTISQLCNATCITFYTDSKLIAFIETAIVNEIELKSKIKTTLPEYMIPAKIVAIAKFELNTNGKIDRNKLLANT